LRRVLPHKRRLLTLPFDASVETVMFFERAAENEKRILQAGVWKIDRQV
jgi:hypothetical protein